MDEIELGDLVRLKQSNTQGIVSGIKDYGTHVCYFLNIGQPLKFPAKREWIELVKKANEL